MKAFITPIAILALAILPAVLTPATPAAAQVQAEKALAGNLVHDGFDSGTRLSEATPLAVLWYSMNGPATDLAIVKDTGKVGPKAGQALQVTPSAACEGIVAQLPHSITLMNGQSIWFSFQFRFTATTNLNQDGLLRFGIMDSRGTPTAPPVGTGDDDACSRVDDFGYYAATNPGLASKTGTTLYRMGTAPELNKPTHAATMTYGPTMAGNIALQTVTPGASMDCGTISHTAKMTISRKGTTLAYAVTIDGQPAASGTENAPLTYVYDSIAIATGPGKIPSPFLIENVNVNFSHPSQSPIYKRFGVFVDSGSSGFGPEWTNHYNTFLNAMDLKEVYFTPNFCDGSPLHGQNGSMTSAAQYDAGTQWGNPLAKTLTPIASIPLGNKASTGKEELTMVDFADIVAGKYDSDYDLVFAAYTDGKWPMVYLRIGWEQNNQGSAYPWYAGWDAKCAAAYVEAWKHVANLAHAYAKKHNVTIKTLWCPCLCNWSPHADATYPADAGCIPGGKGDQYVDIVGFDVYTPVWPSHEGDGKFYDFGLNSNVETADEWATTGKGAAVNRCHWLDYPGATYWGQFSTGGGSLAWVTALSIAHHKPFCIPETGSNNNDHNTGPIDDPVLPLYLSNRLSQAIAQGLDVLFVAEWDGGGFSCTDGSRPKQLASWKQFIKNMAAISPP